MQKLYLKFVMKNYLINNDLRSNFSKLKCPVLTSYLSIKKAVKCSQLRYKASFPGVV